MLGSQNCRYSTEVPDSYEHLIHDVIDGDNHLFMRSDEVAAAWNILSPVLEEIDKHHTAPEHTISGPNTVSHGQMTEGEKNIEAATNKVLQSVQVRLLL